MKPWTYVVAAVVAMVAGAWAMRGWDAAHATQGRIDTLTVAMHTVDTIYRTDTLTFNRILKVAVNKRDTVVRHLTDTLLVKAYIGLQDSVIRSCQSVVLTCERRVAIRDSIIDQYRKLRPSRISLGVIGGCGYGVKGADCIIGAGFSWRIF